MLLIGALFLIGAAARWYPTTRDRLSLYVLQQRCLEYCPPANEVVYESGFSEEGRGRTSALLADPRYQPMSNGSGAYLVPTDWSDFYARLAPPGLKSDGTVFLGRMKTPRGDTRLVGFDLVVHRLPSGLPPGLLVTARVIRPGPAVGRPALLSATSVNLYAVSPSGLTSFTNPITPGQIDPNDPAHVILFGGRVDAWLKDDDTVDVAPRAGLASASTPPAPGYPASPPTSAGSGPAPSAPPAGR
jgi:hypothetical protein